jgi:hypothetical protein
MVSTSGSSGMAHLLSLSQRLGRYPEALYHQESEQAASPEFPVRGSRQVRVCGFLHGKPHEAY